jgi:hypothetical protein
MTVFLKLRRVFSFCYDAVQERPQQVPLTVRLPPRAHKTCTLCKSEFSHTEVGREAYAISSSCLPSISFISPSFLTKTWGCVQKQSVIGISEQIGDCSEGYNIVLTHTLIISRVRPCERIHRPVCTRQIRHRQMSCCLYDAKRAATAVMVLNSILDVC